MPGGSRRVWTELTGLTLGCYVHQAAGTSWHGGQGMGAVQQPAVHAGYRHGREAAGLAGRLFVHSNDQPVLKQQGSNPGTGAFA